VQQEWGSKLLTGERHRLYAPIPRLSAAKRERERRGMGMERTRREAALTHSSHPLLSLARWCSSCVLSEDMAVLADSMLEIQAVLPGITYVGASRSRPRQGSVWPGMQQGLGALACTRR
jgi:hypothetical protein